MEKEEEGDEEEEKRAREKKNETDKKKWQYSKRVPRRDVTKENRHGFQLIPRRNLKRKPP